jgi:hypothetical protein
MTAFNPLQYRACLSALPAPAYESAWQEHIPFGMALIEMLRPRVLVELGVHQGGSYLAFCEAVATLGLPCSCYGVDTFAGDEHAGNYGQEVENALRALHDARYGAFSRVVKATFDEAAAAMPDGSIDLLHIDGFHTYEAVAHDFATWLPKLSERAVVLFHDTNVRERGFGVWKLWEEVRARYPHFAFQHGHGLGVLAVGRDVPKELASLLSLDAADAARVEDLFFLLGNRLTLQRRIAVLEQHAQDLGRSKLAVEQQLADRDHQLAAAQMTIKEYQQGMAEVQRENRELRGTQQQITESLSFRVGMGATAPLRWVAGKLG